jgi:4-hydroxy-tetrahydrodipicolinate reductase
MKIGVVGCAGRMGQMLVREIDATAGCELAGGTEAPGHADIGKDIAALAGLAPAGIEISDDTETLFETSDAVIEFSLPEATTEHAQLAADMATALVIGTTGLTPEQQEQIEMAADITPIFQAPNMAVGVNLLFALTEKVASLLGDDYDIEILEMHHRHKVDAPSGTALGLGQAAAKGRGVELDAVAQRGRDGITGARKTGDIGFGVLRGGDVVGDHTVVFAGEGERVELVHKASSRVVFARGAVRAALWTAGQPPGLYSMKDMLRFD